MRHVEGVAAATAAKDQDRDSDSHQDGQGLLAFVLADLGELLGVGLVLPHGLEASLLFRGDAGALDFGLPQGFEASRFFTLAVLLGALLLFFFPQTPLLFFYGATAVLFLGSARLFRGPDFRVLFLLDALLFQTEQLVEGEENRALLLLFAHGVMLPRSACGVASLADVNSRRGNAPSLTIWKGVVNRRPDPSRV